ncbi:DNA methyltransferase [Mesoflavibacter zeaxanthinifaciens]|uniref:DNA methyltransferase n=1 Tax=Mesoflavibacter zeaxanthinifaciens TaxID=393060 RepID=UPI003A90DCB1
METKPNTKITVLGKTFNTEVERRTYFREELRKKLPELKKMEGFPIGEDEDILNLSDPPYYTACPNPWLNDFIKEWEEEKKELERKSKRTQDSREILPYTNNIIESVNNEIYRSHTYHTKVPHPAISKLYLHYTKPGDIIIDSFAGTGMAGVAARKCDGRDIELTHRFNHEFKELKNIELGERKAILNDLSPIAYNISKTFNSNFNIPELENEISSFRKRLSSIVAHLFTTEIDGVTIPINYTVWTELLLCKSCNSELNYHNLTSDYENNIFTNILTCPNCGTDQKRTEAVPLKETFYDNYIEESVTQLKYDPVLINYSGNKGRKIKVPDFKDKQLALFDESSINDKYVPVDKIIKGDKSSDPYRVGATNIHHFYSPRIRFFLKSYFSLLNLKEFRESRDLLTFILTAILPKLTRMNRFMPKHGSRALVGPMANTLYIPPMYVENNPLDQFDFQAKKIFNAFLTEHPLNAGQVGSATSLPNLADNTIDYVFVDPPFGANIMYSELNQITESWLKLKTNNNREAIENKSQNKSKFEYQDLMLASFKELHRILKPGKYMTVQFSNTSAAVWNTIQNSINQAGFYILNVITNDNTRGGLHAMLGPTAVKQNLIINCFKPNTYDNEGKSPINEVSLIDLTIEILNHLPRIVLRKEKRINIYERTHKILYDKLLTFFVSKGLPVPIDSKKYRDLLIENFIERDGMFFTNEQVQEYDKKKKEHPDFIQLSLLISSEQDGVLWLKNFLVDKALTYQDIQPQWMQALAGVRKGDVIPELATILEENFLKNESGKWYAPDPENEADLDKLRRGRLLRLFEGYKKEIENPRTKIKEVRVEALREGFKQCYQDKDFKTIIAVGDRIPNNLLMEDEVLLQFYDIASSRV